MEEDVPLEEEHSQAETLLRLAKGPLAASAARLSAHSRAIPSGRDFHYFHNFDQFRSPARDIASLSGSLLGSISSSTLLGRGQEETAPQAALPDDLDDLHELLVSMNDEILEKLGASMDEFRSAREEEERGATCGGKIAAMEAGGFVLVRGKKGKKDKTAAGVYGGEGAQDGGAGSAVKVASRDKKTTAPRSQVPFHIPSIPRPQDEFKILVNNTNQPFEHVWLERSEDGSCFVHPLEKLSVLDFVDGNIGNDEPVMPPPVENTPFKLVEGVKELKELAAKLRDVDEFAVDLEHNQYRSFQGLTCLMQISTRAEDFIIDTLKLRVHVGPHLREVFKNPFKRKVMHGADRDILWLQRDFGIYVCNLFDTGQASRILQLDRNSLEFLLHYFCGVTANKEYQQADWRLRPLPDDMLKYAREDTHYLLYIYDMMKRMLLSESPKSELSDSLLAEVYRRGFDICMQLYEKELLTDISYLRIYGMNEFDFNSQQLAVVAGLCEWRDNVARAEDESTGYILPNRTLLEIARQMPLTSGMLKRLLRSKHSYVERHLGSVIGIIRNSLTNAAAFEAISEQLKKEHLRALADEGTENKSCSPTEEPMSLETAVSQVELLDNVDSHEVVEEMPTAMVTKCNTAKLGSSSLVGSVEASSNVFIPNGELMNQANVRSDVSIQTLKKPTGAFGALFGSSSTKKKLQPDLKGRNTDQEKTGIKLEQIKSSVTLPFHSFSGVGVESRPESGWSLVSTEPQRLESAHQENESNLSGQPDEIILLTDEPDDPQSHVKMSNSDGDVKHRDWFPQLPQVGSTENSGVETDTPGPMSLSELSSSLRGCLQSPRPTRKHEEQRQGVYTQLQPFDYATARRAVKFGNAQDRESEAEDGGTLETSTNTKGTRKGATRNILGEGTERDFLPPRRSQAFPPTGNRSATFR